MPHIFGMQNLHIFQGVAIPFVFSLHGCQNRLDTCCATTVKIATVKSGRDLLVNDALANCVRQDTLQPITHLDKHLMLLHENEEHRAVVFAFLSHLP